MNGFPVHPYELDLPAPRYNEGKQMEFNNHHFCWTRQKMGLFVLTQTMRDMDENQLVMSKDVHFTLHDRYDPPKDVPTPYDLMDYVDDSFAQGKLLRYGSASNPIYKTITPQLRRACMDEYGQLK